MTGLLVPICSTPRIIRCEFCKSTSIALFGLVVFVEPALTAADSKEQVAKVLALILSSTGEELRNRLLKFCNSPEFGEFVDEVQERKANRSISAEDSHSFLKLGLADFKFAEEKASPMLVRMLESVGGHSG